VYVCVCMCVYECVSVDLRVSAALSQAEVCVCV
jgi:hypothetical protein